jgi:hypothetical protein
LLRGPSASCGNIPEQNRIVESAGSESFAVGRENEQTNTALRGLQLGTLLARLDLPQYDAARDRAAREQAAVGRKRDRANRPVAGVDDALDGSVRVSHKKIARPPVFLVRFRARRDSMG